MGYYVSSILYGNSSFLHIQLKGHVWKCCNNVIVVKIVSSLVPYGIISKRGMDGYR